MGLYGWAGPRAQPWDTWADGMSRVQSLWLWWLPRTAGQGRGWYLGLTTKLLTPPSPQADSGTRPLLLAGYEDGSVALWDVSERKAYSRIACHEEPVMGLDFDPQRTRGVSGSAGKALAVWSLDGRRALQVSAQGPRPHPSCPALTV